MKRISRRLFSPSDIISLIDQFLQMCPVGEFEERLNLISAFYSHRCAKQLTIERNISNDDDDSDGTEGILYFMRLIIQFAITLNLISDTEKTFVNAPSSYCQEPRRDL